MNVLADGPWRTGRLADDDLGVEEFRADDGTGAFGILQGLDQSGRRVEADRVDGLADCGERWRQVGG